MSWGSQFRQFGNGYGRNFTIKHCRASSMCVQPDYRSLLTVPEAEDISDDGRPASRFRPACSQSPMPSLSEDVRLWPKADIHGCTGPFAEFAFAVAIVGKADMGWCAARVSACRGQKDHDPLIGSGLTNRIPFD